MQGWRLPQRHDRQQKLELSLSYRKLIVHTFLSGIFVINAACAEFATNKVIVLDPGHTPEQPGALGVKGQYEVVYNDRLADMLANALQKKGYRVILTRTGNQSLSLSERASRTDQIKPALFLSIHHDSAQPKYLEKIITQGSYTGYKTIKPIAGFSIFVSKLNPAFAQSYRFAEILGQQLVKLNRPPSLHHAEKIKGENRELLDKKLGIYRFDNLIVMKKTNFPAVLLETGVIVDTQDEAYVSNPVNQALVNAAIVAAIETFTTSEK
jgi:N-acetylmuramoyl-L-alanine amidase